MHKRGTSALHLNEETWIIDGSNELIVDFLFALVLFLDSTQPWPFKNPKQIFFFGSNKRMTCKSNSNAKPNPGQHHSSFHLLLHSNAGLVFLLASADQPARQAGLMGGLHLLIVQCFLLVFIS